MQVGYEFPYGVYSNDGSRIYYGRGEGGVAVKDLTTGKETKVAEVGPSHQGGTGFVAGRAVAGDRHGSSGRGGHASDRAGGGRRGSRAAAEARVLPQAAMDARRALSHVPGGDAALPAAAEGGEPQPVGVQAQNSNQSIFAIHPDGRKLAFLGGNPKGAIRVMERFLQKPESAP